MTRARLAPIAVFVLFSLPYRGFPPPNPDEVVEMVSAKNFADGRGIRYSLYDDIFPRDVYALRDRTVMIARPVFTAWLALGTKLLSISIAHARWLSLVMGVLVLFAVSFLGPYCAWILLMCPVFWLGARVVNEHLLLLAAGAAVLAWRTRAADTTRNNFIAGAALGFCVLIHPHALIFFIAMLTFIAVRAGRSFMEPCGVMLAGFIAGLLLAVQCVPLKAVIEFHRDYAAYLSPAILARPWQPWQWPERFLDLWFKGPTYLFDTRFTSYWTAGVGLYSSAIALVLVLGFSKFGATVRPWIAATTAAVLSSIAFMARPEALYGLVLLPWAIPAVSGILENVHGSRSMKWIRLPFAAALVLSSICCWRVASLHRARFETFEQLTAQLGPWLGPEKRVAGPCVLWFSDPSENFRDLGAAVTGRYVTQMPWDLRAWLAPWRPQVIIADRVFSRIYLGETPNEALLSKRLGAAVVLVRTVNSSWFGPWDVYEVKWEPQAL